MTVQSKFNIGDTIFYMQGRWPIKGCICGIEFFIGVHKTAFGMNRTTESGQYNIISTICLQAQISA